MTEAIVHADGRLSFRGEVLRCALGRGGVRALKQEGDGATPIGLLPLRRVLYRADRVAIPRTALPREPLVETDGWCDDTTHRDYNRKIVLPHSGRHEELWRRDSVYDIICVLGWNDAPVERHRGSAIFLHVARPDYAPTDGCVALPVDALQRLLAAGLSAIRVLG